MPLVYLGKFYCKTHSSSRAEVACRTHHRFLCTNCLIARECGDECDLKPVSEMQQKRNELLALDLINLYQIANIKLESHADTAQAVGAQKEALANQMDEECESLKKQLEEMKEASKVQVMGDLDKMLERSEREKTSLSKVTESLQKCVGQLVETVDGKSQIKPGSNAFQTIISKKVAAEKTVAQASSDDRLDEEREFQLALYLQDIKHGRKKAFGKATIKPSSK